MGVRTRAQMRDDIRIGELNLPVASASGGATGDPASTHPRPTNALLNLKMFDAIEMLAQEGGFSVAKSVTQSVDAQTDNGPLEIDLWEFGISDGQLPQGAVNSVRRASWYDGSTYTRLAKTTREGLDRDESALGWGSSWQENQSPSTPMQYWLEGNSLFLYPAPSAAGTLKLIAGVGVTDFVDDNDYIDDLPVSLQIGVRVLTAQLVASAEAGTDPEMGAKAQALQAQVDFWLTKAREFRFSQNAPIQGQITARSYRSLSRRGARCAWPVGIMPDDC